MRQGFWRGRPTLLTGNTGFKGAWLSLWLRELGAHVVGYSLTPPTKPSLFDAARIGELVEWEDADVCDLARLDAVFARTSPEVVFHLAAQSLVRASYEEPVATFATNVMGTVNVLEAARRRPSVRAVVIVTSDKCYEHIDGESHPFGEDDRLGGFDPYSTSKACAELVTTCYRRSMLTSGVAVASARAGNVIGGGDWARDRLLPDLIAALSAKQAAFIRNPRSIRPWQHVTEPLAGYLLLGEKLCSEPVGEAWNFGPDHAATLSVSVVADEVCKLWGEGASWSTGATNQPHEAHVLTLDSTKARTRLGWSPRLDHNASLQWTVEWYKAVAAGADAREVTLRQIHQYLELSK